MPHINRIRVNNVKYNFGTQYYDDFLMRFSCKNTIYDLANGGGKSVLMLLLLQNLIPNCTLDEKQPIEKLFRTSDGSKTIHSLIEWRLSDAHVKNNYKYMLTGFCARKAKDEAFVADDGQESAETTGIKENAAIEYFNYVIFYREFNDNDIKNLPLSKGKERITYNGLKAYLRDLEKKDLSLEIKIFERKGDYQRFIAGYGLYESEWEIIRGINKTEGHVRTYFETNYKTTRKVVEDLLIEEIIQKSFVNQTETTGETDYMAKTLLDIKDKLLELSAKKEDIQSFDRQIEVIDGFTSRVQSIKQLYFGREDITESILKCFNTVKAILNKNERDTEELHEREASLKEGKIQIDSFIDGAKISGSQAEALELGREIEELINEQGLAAMDLKAASEELTLKESINDYGDYIYYRNQRDEVRQFIDSCLKDKGQLAAEITELTGQVCDRIDRQQSYIESELEKEQKILEMERAVSQELSGNIDKCNGDIAVFRYLLQQESQKEEQLNKEIATLKNNLELYMIADIHDEIKSADDRLKDVRANLQKNRESIAQAEERKNSLEYALHDIVMELDKTNKALSENIDTRARLSELVARAEKLMEIYGNGNKILAGDIKLRSREAVLEEEALTGSLARKKVYLEQLRNGSPVGISPEMAKVREYIERYHGDVVMYGADYLKERSTKQRQELLDRLPVLPYSLVVMRDYQMITGDGRLKELELGDYAVPVISEQALNENGQLMDNMSMMFIMGNGGLFTDEKLVEREIAKTLKDIEDIEFKLEIVSEKVKVLQEDYDFAKEYETVYVGQIEEASDVYEKLRYDLKALEAKHEECQGAIRDTDKNLNELHLAEKSLENALAESENRYRDLQAIEQLIKQADEADGRAGEAGTKLKKSEKEKSDMEARYEAGLTQSGERAKRIALLKKQREDNSQRMSAYRKYYKEGNYPESPMSDDELEARLKGLIGAFEKDNSDLADKQKLVENYDIAMEKSLQAIDYKGLSLDVVREKYESLSAGETSREELLEIKQKIETAKSCVDSYVANIARLRSKKDRLEGAIAHGKSAMEEKYGEYRPVMVDNGDYKGFIEEKKKQGDAIDIELEKVKSSILLLQKNAGKYAVLEKDVSKVMERAGVTAMAQTDNPEYVMSEQDFEETIARVLDRFEKYTKDMSDKRAEFEHEKQLLADTLRRLSAEPLAEEVKNSVTMPANVQETDELMESLRDICRCLELEKERVGKSIDDMEKIKDNFENQCLQTCVNIKNELDRLPKQSKISMDNETISIINLTVPYVKEEQYKIRMSQYIDETTKTADEIKTESERIKYIKSRLSWKKLFSVIVTDMNGIRLNLYKRERIKEQSRYLKYEEAVGSTGQSQGIYIQFLIAIINYIASINSRDKDTGLRKVIFIDNPFGAAKDIYIWEPIFKLLKTNNVQLVVPARGVTPAITGRFDVNYILGQKLIDGRQQTVVVDYSSHVDNEQMDYTKLEFQQATLF